MTHPRVPCKIRTADSTPHTEGGDRRYPEKLRARVCLKPRQPPFVEGAVTIVLIFAQLSGSENEGHGLCSIAGLCPADMQCATNAAR